jgi:hypothetical protein
MKVPYVWFGSGGSLILNVLLMFTTGDEDPRSIGSFDKPCSF